MICTCETETLEPNAGPTDDYFSGIVRFRTTRIISLNRDCPQHGWRADVNVAAILRYGD